MRHRWGIIGFGEAGRAFAAQLSKQNGARLFVTDPLLNGTAASPVLRTKVGAISAEVIDDIATLVQKAEVCLSLVTPTSALAVAHAAGQAWREGLFIDCNSVSPDEKREMAGCFPPGAFVGAAILGSIAGEGTDSRIVLDGLSAEKAEEILNAAGFRSKAISTNVGAAAALKMCRSVFMKGIECLLIETMLAASEFEITPAVLESVEDTLQRFGFAGMVEMLVTTHAVHCRRRSDEMEKVSGMLTSMRLPNSMSAASGQLLAASARFGVTGYFQGQLPPGARPVIEYLKRKYKENF